MERDELLRQRDLLAAACEQIRELTARQYVGEPVHPDGCACPRCQVRDIATRALHLANVPAAASIAVPLV